MLVTVKAVALVVCRVGVLAGWGFISMSEELGAWAAGLLVDEAWAAYREDRYEQALAAAGRAAEAAGQLDDPVLLVRALRVQAYPEGDRGSPGGPGPLHQGHGPGRGPGHRWPPG